MVAIDAFSRRTESVPADALIMRVSGLGKRYQLGHRAQATTLGEAVAQRVSGAVRRVRRPRAAPPSKPAKAGSEPFWALQDVSFQIRRGEVVGVIGRNGAGKSTLLKLLGRVAEPTVGKAELWGRVGSLLEVGTGFHPELTGRENVFLNGSILGMTRAEIRRRFDEIVAFAGVEKFLDTPVKRYSSGMYVRLAFAVAAHLDSEVLIVDEVLAVGDTEFQQRCLGRMRDVARGGRTVLFVSHNLAAVRSLCTRAILLRQGRLLQDGDVEGCLKSYGAEMHASRQNTWTAEGDPAPGQRLAIREVRATLTGSQPRLRLDVSVRLESLAAHRPAFVAVDVLHGSGVAVTQAVPQCQGFVRDDARSHRVDLEIDLPALIPGDYHLSVWAGSHNTETLDMVSEVVGFEVEHSPTPDRTFPHHPDHGFVVAPSRLRDGPAPETSARSN